MKHTFFRRRKKIIKPRYQLKSAFISVVFLYIYSLFFGAAVFLPLASDFFSATSMDEQAKIASVFLALHERIWLVLVVISLLVFISSILSSHRIAGPIYRLEMAVDQLLKGNFKERIRLRKYDEFPEIERVFNEVAGFLETSQSRDAEFLAAVKEKLTLLAGIMHEAGGTEDVKQAKIVDSLIKELETKQDFFRLPSN